VKFVSVGQQSASKASRFLAAKRYRAFKMIRQLTIILTILTFVSCQNNTTENQVPKLEKFILETDSLTSDSETFDQISNLIQSKGPELEKSKLGTLTDESNGIMKDQSFRFHYDTTRINKNQYYRIRIKEYESDRQAAEAFREIIEFHACCVPDEDLIKLKNFENLDHFKNGASITLLTDNVIIKASDSSQQTENKEISDLIDEILKDRKYLKLEIGHGGPAIWTRKNAL
jgi:hypothetical protein